MMPPMTLADLEEIASEPCEDCGGACHSRQLFSECHPRSGMIVSYTAGTGNLQIQCRKCKRFVCEIVVGEREYDVN
jgi:hypothetical protein